MDGNRISEMTVDELLAGLWVEGDSIVQQAVRDAM